MRRRQSGRLLLTAIRSMPTATCPSARAPTRARMGARGVGGDATRQLGWAWLLALALVIGPLLAGVHAVVHPGALRAGTSVGPAVVAAAFDAAAAHGDAQATLPAWRQMFGAHSDAGDCRLFDQLCASPGLHAAPSPLPPPAAPSTVVPVGVRAGPSAQSAAHFQARAPPSIR